MRLGMAVHILGIFLLCAGCALFTYEAPRLTLASGEGKFVFVDKVKQPKDKIFAAVMEWIPDHYNSFNTTIELKDKDAGVIAVKGWAGVRWDGREKQCHYLFTLRISENKLKFEFETRDLANGYAPSAENIKQMETCYLAIRTDILAKLNAPEL